MTGEMSWINKETGEAGDGNSYELHARIAKELKSDLEPFDTYIGPYIDHELGKIFISSEDGASGTVCMWLDGIPPAYREPIVENYAIVDDFDLAMEAINNVLEKAKNANRTSR